MNGELGQSEHGNGRMSISELEMQLAGSLQPVEARPLFVRDLKRRLLSTNEVIDITTKPKGIGAIIVVIASLISGTLLVVVGIKGFRHMKVQTVLKDGIASGSCPATVP